MLRFLFLAALNNCGVRFALLTADKATRIVKMPDEEWDSECKARAAVAMRFDGRKSNIADAVVYATEFVQFGASNRTVKIVFVLTDGYDASPERLKNSLAFASSQDVMVVGIGIGYFTDGVIASFPYYVVVNRPTLLPNGLRRFFSGEGRSEKPKSVTAEECMKEIEEQELKSGFKPDDPWINNMKRVFEEEVGKSEKHLKCATASLKKMPGGHHSMDICFIMDTTGSMCSHLENAKKYVKTLADNIGNHMKSFGMSNDLRMAFVTYKHFGNSGHLENQNFTSDIEQLKNKVNSMISSGGGGDEDTFGGVMTAMNFKWEADSKFVILIGDMPDHILNCSGCGSCKEDRKKRSSGGIMELIRRMIREKIRLFFVRITGCTRKDEKRYEEEYQKANFKEGFVLLDITKSGADEKLKSMIETEIVNVIVSVYL